MTDLPVQRFPGRDGVELAWREVGSGRPFVLLHGLMGSGARLAGQGLVPALAERGYRVILPDADAAALPAGSPEAGLADWIRQSEVDARAVGLVLGAFVATPADTLRPVFAPTLVIVGDRDSRGTSADSLAALLPHGRLVLVPGDHLTALAAPEFTKAVLEFLGN
jgi:pimeloyl-ACP methyl ester carboxylesterase